MNKEDAQKLYQRLELLCAELIPGFRVAYKDEAPSQLLLSLLIKPFVPRYMTDFTTTLYPKVYFPSRDYPQSYPNLAWKTLAHELVHLWDAKGKRLRFSLSYLMPQLLGLGALGALAAPLTPWALAYLPLALWLLPWPAPWRTKIELRGYAMDIALHYWTTGRLPKAEHIRRLFTGWAYYRMCPHPQKVAASFDEINTNLQATVYLCLRRSNPIYGSSSSSMNWAGSKQVSGAHFARLLGKVAATDYQVGRAFALQVAW